LSDLKRYENKPMQLESKSKVLLRFQGQFFSKSLNWRTTRTVSIQFIPDPGKQLWAQTDLFNWFKRFMKKIWLKRPIRLQINQPQDFTIFLRSMKQSW